MESYTQIQSNPQKSRSWVMLLLAVLIALCACIGAFALGHHYGSPTTTIAPPPFLTAENLPFGIVDPHVHFMLVPNFSYPFISPKLNHNWGVRDFNSAASGIAVDKIIFMEVLCTTPLEEAQWVQSIVDQGSSGSDYRPGPNPSLPGGRPAVAGIVASARLDQGEEVARQDLEILLETVPALRGIRRVVQNDPDDMACMTPDYIGGVRAVGNASRPLFVDMGIRKEQIKCVYLLASKFPNIRFLVDHIGKPDIAGGALEPWTSDLSQLSTLKNVHIKLSGLVDQSQSEAEHFDSWTIQQLTPYVVRTIKIFGWDRVMFAGNWIEVLHYSSWRRWVEGLLLIVQSPPLSATPTQLQQLFRDNADKFHS